MLWGRMAQTEAIEDALRDARAGLGTVLILRGEAGSGKSALLDEAAERAGDVLILRAVGFESETGLAFSGLHQLFAPVLDRAQRLPPAQRSALLGALGVEQGGADRFMVCVASLGLLSEVAADGVACLIDDLQWLDPPTADVLAFVARRIEREPIAMLVAVRDPVGAADRSTATNRPSFVVPAGTTVRVDGLDAEATRALLGVHREVPVARAVAAEIAERTGGNALAISELSRTLPPEALAGTVPLPDPLPVGASLEAAFADQVAGLPPDTRLALLVAATDALDVGRLLAVAGRLGVDASALESAERAGLVMVNTDGVTFRHPLIRSTVYRQAGFLERRRVHLAFAAVLTSAEDADRALTHRAKAALGPDEEVAGELSAGAARALDRGAPAAAALAFEQAAALSDGSARAARLAAAADAAWAAGRSDQVLSLLSRAEPVATEPRTRALLALVRGRYETRRGDVGSALTLLLSGAESAVSTMPDLALSMLLEALLAAAYAGDVPGFVSIGELASRLRMGADDGAAFYLDVLAGVGALFGGDPASGLRLLQRAGPPPQTVQGWLHAGHAAAYGGDPDWGACYARAVEAARASGAVADLPYALALVAGAARFRGDVSSAEIAAREGLRLAQETGQDADGAMLAAELAMVAAIRDDEETCETSAAAALDVAIPRRITLAGAMATWAVGLLRLGRGNADEAVRHLLRVRDVTSGVGNVTMAMFSAADLVEALYRSDRRDEAAAALADVTQWATSGMAYARLAAARSQAMLTADGWEPHYREALAVEAPDVPPFERARTELAYGQALRRYRRPSQARGPLAAAAERFDRVGASAWAERARAELRASGQSVHTRGSGSAAAEVLTAQELQIVRMVAAGSSNQAVAAALFLSPRTIEYHLYKAYPKLGIASRGELARIDLGEPNLAGDSPR